MLAVDGLLSILVLGFWLFCLIDVITADSSRVRLLPKFAWALVVIVLFAVGGLAWLLLGRPPKDGWPGRSRGRDLQPRATSQSRPRPRGPEDSPEYEERMRRAQERLRRRPDDDGGGR